METEFRFFTGKFDGNWPETVLRVTKLLHCSASASFTFTGPQSPDKSHKPVYRKRERKHREPDWSFCRLPPFVG